MNLYSVALRPPSGLREKAEELSRFGRANQFSEETIEEGRHS